MYKVSILKDGTVLDVFDPAVYIDASVETFEITDSESQAICSSGNHGLWALRDGVIVSQFPPEPVQPVTEGAQTL